mmetsp:Transcript_25150/g.54900  ORF Transcript_25150/g.54900 Transcript_25150/m.54900 type:complete len:501 (+) Transcript_25150:100-1602(+)
MNIWNHGGFALLTATAHQPCTLPRSSSSINRKLAFHPRQMHHTALLSKRAEDDTVWSLSDRIEKDWGVDFEPSHPTPPFPRTCSEVADCCLEAISATLHDEQRLDPNLASNAMHRSVLDHRPVHNSQGRDKGRMGIEIDGARYLLESVQPSVQGAEGRGIRRVALILASKLAQSPWDGATEPEQTEGDNAVTDTPLLVYFNCRQSSLLASRELSLLKQEEIMKDQRRIRNHHTGGPRKSAYDNVRVLSLDEGIPDEMFDFESSSGRQSDLNSGRIDPLRGMVLVVQPTDLNSEAQPPATTSGKILSLQKVLAQASIACLPSVVLSPRLTEQYATYERERNGHTKAHGSFSHSGAGGGFDQSGYQQSATYGGAEPPRGPTPWITRDFTPPVFVWVGCALEIAKRRKSPASIFHFLKEQEEEEEVDPEQRLQYCSTIGLMQSVCDAGRPWHLFVSIESLQREHGTYSPETSYHYVASTKASAGRPPSNILENIHKFWLSEHL